jgi:YHS domain-containing protein
MNFRRSFLPGIAVLFVILAFTANTALAGGEHCKSAEGAHCQNIIKTAADGGKVAVCACGMEFTVTDDSPSIVQENKRYFVCSDQCAEKINADPAKFIPVLEQKVAEVKKAQNISGNIMSVDAEGNRIAMCSCGAEMKVTDASVSKEHDGEAFYFCCDHCAAGFEKDAAGQMKAIQEKICDKRHQKPKEI